MRSAKTQKRSRPSAILDISQGAHEIAGKRIREPLDWVSDQIFKVGDLSSGIRGMLLLRQLYWNDESAPQALGSSSNILNVLLDRTQMCYWYEAIDSLGSMLDLTILRSLGDRVGEHLCHVQRLYLTGKHVTDDDISLLKSARQLRRLELFDTAITDAGLKHLEGLTELRHLSLAGSEITDEGLRSLSWLAELRVLHLNRTAITSAGMVHLWTLTQLERLTLIDTQVGDEGLEPLGKLPALQELILQGTRVTDRGLEHLRSSPRLYSVGHRSTQTTDEAHEALLRELPGWIEYKREIDELIAQQKERMARQNEPSGSEP